MHTVDSKRAPNVYYFKAKVLFENTVYYASHLVCPNLDYACSIRWKNVPAMKNAMMK